MVDDILDPFGRNQLPGRVNLSVQQFTLSVEQNSPCVLVIVIKVLLLSWLGPCSSLTPIIYIIYNIDIKYSVSYKYIIYYYA